MRRLRNLAVGIWEFVVGDDWVTALGVAVALGVTALFADYAAAWLLMPLAVTALLASSIWRAARAKQ
jgi:hypothetical protein